jgi:hypothetical protein
MAPGSALTEAGPGTARTFVAASVQLAPGISRTLCRRGQRAARAGAGAAGAVRRSRCCLADLGGGAASDR